MKNKSLVLAIFVLFLGSVSFAATKNHYTVPVNQQNIPDSYALPCTPVSIPATGTTSGGNIAALDEAGMVYWIALTPSVAGDYAVFRDSDTANTSSTLFMTILAPTTTETMFVQFNPPIAVSNGLSVDLSSATDHATVCVRDADGDL